MTCSTIIVSYNTFDFTREAVQSALMSGEALPHEVIVVDNNSPDGSAARLREAFPPDQYPNVRILANTDNPGFSSANNQGAAVASGDVLFFLNPDTLVLKDAIPVMVSFLEQHPAAGAIGPRVCNADGTDQPSIHLFPSFRSLLRFYLPVGDLLRGRDLRSDIVLDTTQPVDAVKGCALAVRRTAFDRVGGWDASIFMYAEELELCLALQKASYINYFVREAEIIHYGGASTASAHVAFQVRAAENHHAFVRRHRPHLAWANRLLGTIGYLSRTLLYRLREWQYSDRAPHYHARRQAASALWKWYLLQRCPRLPEQPETDGT